MVVSVILPAYNAAKYLDRSVSSIYNNGPSLDLYEVIAINDGSKDETLSVLEKYHNRYPNFKVIDKENGGVSSARNLGIEKATGDYVLFLDADDELVEGAFEKVCNYLAKHEEMDMLMTRQIRNNGSKEWLARDVPLEENRSYNGVEAYKRKFIRENAGGGICRTEFLRNHNLFFPEGIKNEEDSIFFILVQVYAQSIFFYNLNLYRIHERCGSASRVDATTKAMNLIKTAHEVSRIKADLAVGEERKAIFDYMSYKVLRDLSSNYSYSKDLSYRKLRQAIDVKQLLPFDVKNCYIDRKKMSLMSISFPLFYFLSWVKQRL